MQNTNLVSRFAEKWVTLYGVSKVRSWAKSSGNMKEGDVFISGNVDEVLSRQVLHQLRWCKTSASLLTGALWVPNGNFDRAMRSDFPVLGRPHTFRAPAIFLWNNETSREEWFGDRLTSLVLTGEKDKFISGGIHMTNHAFLPEAILKELTATEDDFYTGFINAAYLLSMDLADLNREQKNLYNMVDKECWLANSDNINNVTDVEKFVPWFLSCNPHRYPYWIGEPDPRNKDLLISMKDVALSLKQVPQSYWEKSSVRKLFKQSLNPIYK